MATLGNRAKETSTTQGTGTYNLAGASAGFQSLAAAAADISGDGSGPWVIPYVVEDGTDWEIGLGTLTAGSPDTLSRDTIYDSSNGDSAVNWGSGTRNIFISIPGEVLATLLDPEASDGILEQTAALTYIRNAIPLAIAKGGTGGATAGAALTSLGFSAFVQTLINDADADTFLATLGFSALIRALVDDADDATARTTLKIPRRNAIINGCSRVVQRGAYTLVKDAWDFGKVDRWEGMSSGTAVSAGTLTQATVTTLGRTGKAVSFDGVTLTGTGILYLRQRIESANSVRFRNQPATFSCWVRQDTGGAIDYTITLRKADSLDDFSSTTEIDNDGGTSVADGVDTQLEYSIGDMGDCTNGIEVEIKIECGAVTTQIFNLTEFQLEEGSVATLFERKPLSVEIDDCEPYFESTYNHGVAPGTSTTVGQLMFPNKEMNMNANMALIPWQFRTRKRTTPTCVAWAPGSGNSGHCTDSAPQDRNCSAQYPGDGGVNFLVVENPDVGEIGVHGTADAEL